MFTYSDNYEDMKKDLANEIQSLKAKGYNILAKEYSIIGDLSVDKLIIKSKDRTKNRLILSTGLHGIEGYVGHACIKTFFKELMSTLKDDTEVIIYHGLNPYGMKNFRRTNENNVDLNRNFSKNNFQSENVGFKKVIKFFTPKVYKGIKRANLSYYIELTKLILRYGTASLKEATLFGQKLLKEGICYSGEEYQNTTKFVFEELKNVFKDVNQVVWIDLHTGYGPRYQMSIVNSKHEKVSTKEMIENIKYPLILGLNAEEFYEVEGDMLEITYDYHKINKEKCELYATCFEFGTLGESMRSSVSSLKALVFENNTYFINQPDKFKEYSTKLIREQFLPSSEKWRKKANDDFLQAMKGIIQYKKI